MIKLILLCGAILAVAVAERISNTPDVSWTRSPSFSGDSGVIRESNVRPSSLGRDSSFSSSASGSSFGSSSDRDRFPVTGGNSRSGSSNTQTGSRSSFGFDEDTSNSRDRFPITGSSSGNRFGSSGSADSRGSSPDSSRFGSSSGSGGSGSRVSGSGSSFGATTADPTRNYYVRIVASLIQLNNTKGLTSTGSSCSTFGNCDPIILADLDTERPNAAWPGARDVKYWPQIFAAKSQDSIKNIGIENITKDICGQNYREANLRVRVEDKKMLTSNAVINEFDCPVNRVPQDSSVSATWSPVLDCIPRFPSGKQTLSYRYKVFYVSRFSCGISGSTTTTSRSIFG